MCVELQVCPLIFLPYANYCRILDLFNIKYAGYENFFSPIILTSDFECKTSGHFECKTSGHLECKTSGHFESCDVFFLCFFSIPIIRRASKRFC